MPERSDYFLREIFPDAGPELLRLFRGAVDQANLLRSDFYTIRDWVGIGNCATSEEAHALLLLMMTALVEGSLCIEMAETRLKGRLSDLVPETGAADWAHRLANIEATNLPGLIGNDILDDKPLILRTLGERRFLYFQKYLHAELDFESALGERIAQSPQVDADRWPTIVRDVLGEMPLRLDCDQQMALAAALLNNFAVISGGPGTGKTSIVLALLRCLMRGGVNVDRIALAAPTGRAAQRLSDAIRFGLGRLANQNAADTPLGELAASTLHQMLGYRPSRNVFTRHQENPIAADVVIVDEVSMVGVVLMSQLFKACAANTKLILLGDKDQLPSVDAGAVLARLIPENFRSGFHGNMALKMAQIFPDLPAEVAASDNAMQNRVVLLRTNHRSQEHIRSIAAAINRQDAGAVEQLPTADFADEIHLTSQAGCFLLEQTHASAHEIRGFAQRWIEEAFYKSQLDGRSLAGWLDAKPVTDTERARRLFALLERFRLLTLVRDGAWGCNEINRAVALALRPRLDDDTRSPLFNGAPVLITRNDAALGLNNGDVGIALRGGNGSLRVLFERQGGVVSFPAESLPAHELGFALTVHKSQGSEYQCVMVVVPPTGGRRLLTKELIYTGITRAKSLALICSTKEALAFAIGRKIVRESAMTSK